MATPIAPDPLDLAQRLIRCPSVTPEEGGALDLLQGELEALGFTCTRLTFEEEGTAPVENLYARIGQGRPNFCFAGHTDVVPPGDPADWSGDPFESRIVDGELIGRGASDMKGAIAAFTAAAGRFLAARRAGAGGLPEGAISLLITGDEEGPSINGTRKVLDWLAQQGEALDACLVGEPTNPSELGEMVKIGRRGSLTGQLTVFGRQGHTAYPQLADNAAHRLVRMLDLLIGEPLDGGTEHFQASTLQVSTIDVGNPASNIVPGKASAAFNIRFNDAHSGASLERWLRERLDRVGGRYELAVQVSGESFLCPPGRLSEVVVGAVEAVTGRRPELSTTGGTSDARFIKDHCAVAEFGLVGKTMHQVDERVAVADIETLAQIYAKVLEDYFE